MVAIAGSLSTPAASAELISVEAALLGPVAVDTVEPVEVAPVPASVALLLPVPIRGDTLLLLGADYRHEVLRVRPVARASALPGRLHAARSHVGVRWRLPQDWTLLARVSGGLAGDLAQVDTGLLRLEALVVGTHPLGPRVTLGGGVTASYALGQLLPLPILVLQWEPAAGVRLDASLPSHVRLSHTLGRGFEYGAVVDLTGQEYAIRAPGVAAALGCDREAAGCVDHIAYVDAFAGGTAAVRLRGDVWLSVAGGHSVYRRFETLDVHGEATEGGVGGLPRSWQARAAVAWRAPRSSTENQEAR